MQKGWPFLLLHGALLQNLRSLVTHTHTEQISNTTIDPQLFLLLYYKVGVRVGYHQGNM